MSEPETPRGERAVHAQRLFVVPDDATEVILVRHGASQSFVEGEPFEVSADGHGDPPLADLGREQAEAVGRRLAGERVDRLFVTTLRRTHETAAPFVARSGLEPEVVGDLREIHLGEWERGLYREKMAARDPLAVKAFTEEEWGHIPGAETSDAFGTRVRRGLDHVVAATGPGRVAVAVVHGGTVAEACHQATRSHRFAFIGCDNTALTRLVSFADGRRRLRSYNDIGHLMAPVAAAD